MGRIDVLLADDHETVRHGLRLLVDEQPDMRVVGEAGDGATALARIEQLHPTVAVVDISMPGMNGLEATRQIRRVAPHTAVVALTRHEDQAHVRELLAAGALGYVLKRSASHQLIRAIRAAARGRHYLDVALNTRLTAETATHRQAAPGQRPISAREADVLRMMALGHSNKDIGAALNVAVKTVEVHKANAMRKLDLRGRIDVVRYALLQGWLKDQGE